MLQPAFDLQLDLGEIRRVTLQQKGLRERNQVLMTIQLPDELVISHAGGIEIWNCAEIIGTGLDSTLVVAAPTNLRARVQDLAEDWKSVTSNLTRRELLRH